MRLSITYTRRQPQCSPSASDPHPGYIASRGGAELASKTASGPTAKTGLLVVGVLAAAIYLTCAGRPVLLDESDAVNAEVSRGMVASGDWLTPRSALVPRLNKPPMTYWAIAAAFGPFGLSDFTARLPMAAAVVGVALFACAFGGMFSPSRAGMLAGIVACTCPGVFVFTRTISGDALFTLFLCAALYAFLRGYIAQKSDDRARAPTFLRFVFYGSLGLAVMSKGLIGLVFPVATIVVFLALVGDAAYLRRLVRLDGIALFLAISAPWHIAMAVKYPGFAYNYFLNEHLLRSMNMHYPADFRNVPIWEFWAVSLAGLFPWVCFLPAAVTLVGRSRRVMCNDTSVAVFLSIWAMSVMLFFSVSARLEHYALPAYPALAGLIGYSLARSLDGASPRTFEWGTRAMGIVGAVVGCGVVVLLLAGARQTGADLLNPHNQLTFFAAAGGLSGSSLSALRPELLVLAVSMLVVSTAAVLLARAKSRAGMALGVAGAIGVLAAVQMAVCKFEPYLSHRAYAEVIESRFRPGDRVVVEGELFNVSSIAWYAPGRVYRWRGRPEWEFGSRFEGSRRFFLSDGGLARLWRSPTRVFLIAKKADVRRAVWLTRSTTLAGRGDDVLLSNRAAK